MKKQQHSSRKAPRQERSGADGHSVARSSPVPKENLMNAAFSSVHPIDTLLVQQLEAILNGERELRSRYAALDSSTPSSASRQELSHDLSNLKARTDRLYRLITAMDSHFPIEVAASAGITSSAAIS